ncbi:PEP-CTERM sorting domain-containing protein [Salinisphaera aquimarina]|uniref:PEP-CTERM sorting domain-containing protein n=1 Tax=Salinisphaera aquimarina TaxID=2094031 RepID=A0ABV7EQ45_9GAMM
MRNQVTKLSLLTVVVMSIACVSGAAAANTGDGSSYLQGADYLTSGSTMSASGERVASNSYSGNGVAGQRPQLGVPEPSSITLFGGALLMLMGASLWRRRSKRADFR